MSAAADFAAVGLTLYAAHHVGDYWVQTDHQARHKGLAGRAGRDACVAHVASYVLTQFAFLFIIKATLGVGLSDSGLLASLTVSGVTHYLADRREHGPMFWLASKLPGKAAFMALGRPRALDSLDLRRADGGEVVLIREDNPQLATGAWALDQAWHIFWGVFVAAILAVAL
jgi:hypothetical protein